MGGAANKTRLWLLLGKLDALFKRAADAGATMKMPPADMFWGDRMGRAERPVGQRVDARAAGEGHDARRDARSAGRVRRSDEEVTEFPERRASPRPFLHRRGPGGRTAAVGDGKAEDGDDEPKEIAEGVFSPLRCDDDGHGSRLGRGYGYSIGGHDKSLCPSSQRRPLERTACCV